MLASMDGAEDVITGESVSKGFAMYSILLVSVGKGDVHPSLHIIQGTVVVQPHWTVGLLKVMSCSQKGELCLYSEVEERAY